MALPGPLGRKARHLLNAAPWLVLITGFALTYLVWNQSFRDTLQSLAEEFDFRTGEISLRIEARMKSYEQILQDAAAMETLHNDISRKDFHAYVGRLEISKNFPGTQGIGLSLLARPETEAAITQRGQSEGWSDFSIRPAGTRPQMSAVLYLEPENMSNLRMIGDDLLMDPVRRTSMLRAAALGDVTISGKISLIYDIDGDTVPGVLMACPIYHRDSRLTNQEDRLAALVGWSIAPLRMKDLISGILQHRRKEAEQSVTLRIFDEATDRDPGNTQTSTLLFGDADDPMAQSSPPQFHRTVLLPINGRNWRIEYYSRPSFDNRFDIKQIQWTGLAGAIASILLAAVIWLLLNGRDRAVSTALRMTQALRLSTQQAESIAHELEISQAALAEKAATLELRNRDLAQFTEVLAHHLQEPVRRQHVFAQQLERLLPAPHSPDLIETLGFIKTGAMRLRLLLRDVHLYLSISQHPQATTSGSADEALTLALKRLRGAIAQSSATVQHDPLPPVMIDKHRLADVFFALIENALKYHRPESLPQVHITWLPHVDGQAQFCITDNGIGIPEQFHKRVFRVFERLENSPTNTTGTGIGMSIAQTVIEAAKGTIWIESPPDGGTRICFTLPLPDAGTNTNQQAESKRKPS